MPTWGEILKKFQAPPGQIIDCDSIRTEYLKKIHEISGRNVISYSTNFTSGRQLPPDLISINEEDLEGLMEVIHGLHGAELDLVLHSPGGSAAAAEAMVIYL